MKITEELIKKIAKKELKKIKTKSAADTSDIINKIFEQVREAANIWINLYGELNKTHSNEELKKFYSRVDELLAPFRTEKLQKDKKKVINIIKNIYDDEE